jgi:hypothetical protein
MKMGSASAWSLLAPAGGQMELLQRPRSANCFNNATLSLNFAPNSRPIVPEDAARLVIASLGGVPGPWCVRPLARIYRQEFKPGLQAEESSMAWRKPSTWDATGDNLPGFTNTDWMPPPSLADRADAAAAPSAVPGNQGQTAGQTSGAVPASETVTYAGSGLVFVNSYGAGVTDAFRSEIIAAENFFQSHFVNSCTISCSFDLQSQGPAFISTNTYYPVLVSYAQLLSAMQSHATTPDQLAAVAALSNLADPSGGAGFNVPVGEARILGLAGPGSGVDDSIVLNSYYWTTSDIQTYPNDVISSMEHEISEGAMGRISSLGVGGSAWAPMDLFRYTAAGQHDFTGGADGQATYFSPDGTHVNTGLQFHGALDGYDLADWDGVGSDANLNDPFGPGGPGSGGTGALSATDLSIMDVLGWTPAPPATQPPAAIDDFCGTGTSDILFRNASTGDTWFEAMSNGACGWHQVGGSDPHYSVVGIGDFYGAGTSGILYRNASTGDTWFEAMSAGACAGWHQIGGSDTHYSVAGLGDFLDNGIDDILFRNGSTGDLWLETISAGAFADWDHVGGSSSAYSVVGIGDFDGSTSSEILFRNNSTGDTWFAALSNGALAGWHQIGGSDTHYSVVGVGDFYGTGTSDILFRNNSTGDTWIAAMSNGALAGWHELGGSNTSYSVVGVGDYFGNGCDDVLFRNASTGDTWFAAVSNGNLSGWQQGGGSNTSYTAIS